MLKLVVLISGTGSNLKAIIDAIDSGDLPATIINVISNREQAPGLAHAEHAGIPTTVLLAKDYSDRQAFDDALAAKLETLQPDLVVLAGFMRILSGSLVQRYLGRMLNIHPSLLPHYPGLDTHEKVLASGDKEHGCSVHFVTETLDGGPVIAQARLELRAGDTAASLKNRVHKLEHDLYPSVINWFALGRLTWQKNTAYLDGKKLS